MSAFPQSVVGRLRRLCIMIIDRALQCTWATAALRCPQSAPYVALLDKKRTDDAIQGEWVHLGILPRDIASLGYYVYTVLKTKWHAKPITIHSNCKSGVVSSRIFYNTQTGPNTVESRIVRGRWTATEA